MSKTMEFKSTQKLFNPNEQIPKINNTIKSLKKDEKKKEITIFRCNKTYYEILKDSLIDHIYLTTAQPSNFQRLATLHLILGQSESLADSCRLLGYYSLNEFIRQHKHIFVEFLEIFVTKNNKKTIATDPPFILNYYNKKICYNECLSKSMREAMDEESKPDRDRYLITFEQTKYFEFHNSLDYIDGRKKFAKVVQECRKQGLLNPNGYAPLSKFQQVCQYLFGSTSATVIKEWFPRCGGGMENVMRKIIFEEIDCLFSSQQNKKESEFRIKAGCTFEEICQNLDSLKEDITHFFDKVDRDLSITSSEFKHRSDRRGRYGSSDSYPKRKGVPIIPKVQTGCFGDSDEEAVDLRIENRAFVVANQGNKTYVPKNIEGENVKEVQKPNIKGYFELAEKRRLLPDYDLDNFVPMDFKMDEFDPVFTT